MNLALWRNRCLEWQERDLEAALAYFTFLADVTALAADCRFAGDDGTLVARYDGLPFAAISFYGADGRRIAALAHELLAPGEEFWCIVNQEQWRLVQTVFRVLEAHEEWQMLFRGDPAALDPGTASRLGPADLPEMAALARHEGMMAFGRDPLARGPWYGVRRNGSLIAQGGTHFIISRVAELGNIVTAREYRRQGYGSQVVAALVQAHHAQGKAVFLQVLRDNAPAIACYARLGFERVRTMHLARCRP